MAILEDMQIRDNDPVPITYLSVTSDTSTEQYWYAMCPARVPDDAVAELIGAVVLIAVIALIIGIIGVGMRSQPLPQKIPSLNAEISNESFTIYLRHMGGDPLPRSDFTILVNGIDMTSGFTGNGTDAIWNVGETLTNISSSMPKAVLLVYKNLGTGAVVILSQNLDPGQPVVPKFAAFITSTAGSGGTISPPGTVILGLGDSQTFTITANAFYHITDVVVDGSSQGPVSTYTFSNVFDDHMINALFALLPVANFIGSPPAGWPPPLTVSFTDTSTGSPTTWNWTFGDIGAGNTSTLQSPSHMYTTGGAYSVNLTVTNAGGSNTLIKPNYIAVTPSPPWYSCSWGYRKNITIDKSQVSGTQTNFPVLINLASDNDLKNGARSDGYDILFTTSDGTTKLSHEIEKYTSSTGALVAWVKVPTVTDSANTTIFMYYGYPASPNQQDRTNVWDADFRGVWHLKEDPSGTAPQMLDSTANAWHGTSNGAMTTSDQVAAIVNGGLDLDGSNDYISTNYVQTGVTAYTIEAWIKTSTISMQRVIVHDRGSGAGRSLTLSIGGTYPGGPGVAGGVGYGVDSDNIYIGRYSTTTVNNNNWHHLVGVWTAPAGTAIAPAQFSIYIDGTPAATTDATVGTAPLSPLTGLGGTLLAQHAPWNTYLPSIIDEVRISNTVRNANWILTEYNNQNSPATFHYLGNQEQWTC